MLTLRDLPTRPAADGATGPGIISLKAPRIPTDLCCAHCGEVRALVSVRVVECTRAGGYERNDVRREEWCAECIKSEGELEVEEV